MINKFKLIFLAMLVAQAISQPAAAVEDGQVFKKWTGACRTAPTTGARFCTVVQVLSDDSGKPISRLAIRKVEQKVLVLYVTVPLGVNLTRDLKVSLDGATIAGVPFNFCDPEGCNAAMPMNEKLAEAIKAGKSLTIEFVRVDDQNFTLNASLSGVTAAINSL